MNAGEVFWVQLPARGGHAQMGRRPAIVFQTSEASNILPTVLVVPLTTQLDALRFPGTLVVEPDTQNGLKRRSVAMVFQLAAIDRRFIGSRTGQISMESMGQVWRSLEELTGRMSEA